MNIAQRARLTVCLEKKKKKIQFIKLHEYYFV